MSTEAAFWEWSLARWREDGVEEALLALQDTHQLVVLELLMAAWLGSRGIQLSEHEWRAMVEAADPWVEGVVIPLRERRVSWRGAPKQAGLYSEVKKLEMSAERSLASIYVEALADARVGDHPEPAIQPAQLSSDPKTRQLQAITANLALVLGRARPAVKVGTQERLAELLGG